MSDMTMKISKATVETLKKAYDVNQSVRLKADEDTLKICTNSANLLLHAPLEDQFPRDFNIYDLGEFLRVTSIIDDPTLDFSNDSFLAIKSDDGKQKIRYMESDPDFVKDSYTEKTPDLSDPDIELEVTQSQFASIMDAAKTMKLEYVGFIADGETVSITAFNKNNGDENETNKFSIELMDTDLTFQMFYKLDSQNISVLEGEGDLNFSIVSKKISKVESNSGKTFWVAMNIGSKWEG